MNGYLRTFLKILFILKDIVKRERKEFISMKRKYLICVNHVCPSCSLLLWVTGSLGAPANNTLISDKKWKLKQTCQRFVCGQRRKWQCDFKSNWFQGSAGQNIMLKRDERLEFWAQSCHLKIHHPLTRVQTLGTNHVFVVCCHVVECYIHHSFPCSCRYFVEYAPSVFDVL